MTRIIATAGLGALVLLSAGCAKLQSRDHLNRGVQAYRNARYAEAVEQFKTAVQLDPTNTNGRLYLATSYMTQYIPGADSPENNQLAKAAKEEFLNVLRDNPNDKTALASLASLNYQQAQGIPKLEDKFKKLDEAKDWYMKLIAADPNNKEAYYSLGVIDWLKWYPNLMTARANMGMKPEDPGPLKDKKVKAELKDKYMAMVDDGVKNLQHALDIDKDYDDAMAYMNLLIREKADLDDTKDQYEADTKVADGWVQKALETKKMKAAKQPGAAGGITEGK
ncbi:MAG TPA: tetratricopeptide repeat protein [Bryobacteraceae bacterium]|nr:tetratricopeptide repeat protein [Bryobacteraceae bacterium]